MCKDSTLCRVFEYVAWSVGTLFERLAAPEKVFKNFCYSVFVTRSDDYDHHLSETRPTASSAVKRVAAVYDEADVCAPSRPTSSFTEFSETVSNSKSKSPETAGTAANVSLRTISIETQ
jgi:hypothetical protein